MDRLPPKLVRRIVVSPIALALCLALLVLAPVALLAAAVVDLVLRGPWRTVRLLGFVAAYVALEAAGLVWMFVLWVVSGFGLRLRSEGMQRAHYGFMRWWLRRIESAGRRLFHLQVVIEDAPEPRAGPILVFSRHAGPGNSLLLVGTLVVGFRRRPRVVMLAKLQWEPLYDVMLNRLPNRFITHDPSRRELYTDVITELAGGMDELGAFVLFPEGRNFTPSVRARAIERLRGRGHTVAADRAQRLTHVLPPRHNGVIAALEGAPEADVVFVAHSVLEDVGSLKDLWGRIPLQHPIKARYWRLSPSEIPREQDALIDFLYGWWERIDAWIADHAHT